LDAVWGDEQAAAGRSGPQARRALVVVRSWRRQFVVDDDTEEDSIVEPVHLREVEARWKR
jgi:hypothetical protein